MLGAVRRSVRPWAGVVHCSLVSFRLRRRKELIYTGSLWSLQGRAGSRGDRSTPVAAAFLEGAKRDRVLEAPAGRGGEDWAGLEDMGGASPASEPRERV